ncbi:MAG: glycosyltransferase [Clostridiales bacterium]|nr:glycosyltransferase [Clostridiales bacterium]
MARKTDKHTFVVCAYKESAFLDDTVSRLLNQTVKSRVLISTSTPNEAIRAVANKYGLEVRVNPKGGTSARDWNFAYSQADSEYVTLAHQDDIYEPTFAERTLSALENAKNPVLAYTDYYELRYAQEGGKGERVESNRILRLKRKMLRTINIANGSRWLRNRVLSFGYPMNCPGTTYVKRRFKTLDFISEWQNSHDWEAAIRLASEKGEFLFVPELLLGHRIYLESQTTHTIRSGIRYKEDFECFKKYWPAPIAGAILKRYAKSYDSNAL